MRTISPGAIFRTISPYTQRMVSSLSGQSVGLCGQPSHVASCGSHSAGIEKLSAAGVRSEGCFTIKVARKIAPSTQLSNLRSNAWTATLPPSTKDRARGILPRMSATTAENLPDALGHFGPYGGRFVPETLMHPLQELEQEYLRSQQDPEFQREFKYYLKEFCGRPTPLYLAERLTRKLG